MKIRTLIFLTFITVLFSCRQKSSCEFSSYIKDVRTLKEPLQFSKFSDLDLRDDGVSACDSLFFGRNSKPIGLISKQSDCYSFLVSKSYKAVYLITTDSIGKIIDTLELKTYWGQIQDSLSQWTTYHLRNPNLLLQTDTMEQTMQDEEKNIFWVKVARTDTFKFVRGKITK